MRVETVPDPKILNQTDAIIRITSSAICGSDLHLYGGFVPTMESGDILGHEFMGEVVETGRQVKNLKKGDRVVVPFPIACGQCFFCQRGLTSVCENSNPNAWVAETMLGHPISGVFGYSHMLGGYAGGQAEYARVPFADVNPLKVPEHLTDEQVLFLSDIYPTGYMGADMCNIQPGDTIAVWGCGPVGQFAMKSAFLLGAERVIGIDRFDYRLQMAREKVGAETINYEETSVLEALKEMTGGRGPDACIDAVGMEAHAPGPMYAYDRAKQAVMSETDRPIALREAILACRNGGTVSVIGVYAGLRRQVPDGPAHEPVDLHPHGTVSRPPLHETAARARGKGRNRPEFRHHASHAARRRSERLQHVPQQAGQLREDRAQTAAASGPLDSCTGGQSMPALD